jgi:superfamily II DNA or RNA helicase
MKTTLRSYQRRIIDELKPNKAIAIFAGTGSGKTLMSIQWYTETPALKLLVVCPKSTVPQWATNILKELPDARILQFPKNSTAAKKDLELLKTDTYDIVIVNYDIMSKLTNLLKVINQDWAIILDESHRIRRLGNRNSNQTTKSILKLKPLTPYKCILTATPTEGKYGGYVDYYTQLSFIDAINYSYRDFEDRYVRYSMINYGASYPVKTITGYKNFREIEDLLAKHTRAYKTKYGDFEPQHTKVVVPRSANYDKMLREEAYKEIMLTNTARKRIALKTLASGVVSGQNMGSDRFQYEDNTAKIDWLEDFLSDTDERAVILYQYNVELASLEKLMKKLKKSYIVINGGTQDKIAEIQNKKYDVILGQFKAIGESIDGIQHKSHIEIFFSMPESSLDYRQTIGRIDRIGQEQVPMYYYLVMDGTLDSAIYDMIEKKVEYSEEILNKLVIKGEE